MSRTWRDIRRGLWLRRRRALLTALGITLAAAMLSTALVLADGLGDGFARGARAADLPDVIVRFDPQSQQRVGRRIAALPDVAAFSTRTEFTNVDIAANGHSDGRASAEVVGAGRRGYAIVAGRDVSARFGEVVMETWGGSGLGPDARETAWRSAASVPCASSASPRLPTTSATPSACPASTCRRRRSTPGSGAIGTRRSTWPRSGCVIPGYLNEVLVQARTSSYGLRGVRVITRSGVRVLLDQAAGIVIDLLVALSAFALATAAVMLARIGAGGGAAPAAGDRQSVGRSARLAAISCGCRRWSPPWSPSRPPRSASSPACW